MSNPSTAERGGEIGVPPGFGFWVHGRAGVLGEVSSGVAAAAIGFMAPELVDKVWSARPEGMTRVAVSEAYAGAAADWGRATFSSVDDADLMRVAELAGKVASAALPICGALFAGWRELDAPEDPAGAATHALQVLREMRGGAHLSAIQASGLTPQHAILSFTADQIRGGPAGAERFGWQPPHPEPDEAARAAAEIGTTNACVHAYDALTEEEGEEFVHLVRTLRSAFE